MIRTDLLLLLLSTIVSTFSTSCVGKKRFEQEVSQRDSANQMLNRRILDLNSEIGRLQLDLAGRNGEIKAQKDLLDKQEKQIRLLENEMEKRTTQSLTEQQKMDLALKQKQQEIAEKEQVIKNLQSAIEAQNQAMRGLLGKLQGALQQFSADLSLALRDGKVYIGLSEKLLFKSGSAALGKDAMTVLEKLAAVLNQHPEINILVEGHTDNVPIKSKDFKDNWDLSVIRATTVVRILTKEFYLNPSQLLAAGKGEFEPKASNDTSEGRAANRRTEVILAPRLDEVMKIIQQNR